MSRIYFHSPSGEAEVLGAERAHMGVLVNDLAEDWIRNRAHIYLEPLRELTAESYLQSESDKPHFLSSVITALRVRGDRNLLTLRGRPIDAFAMVLNTAIEVGGKRMRLVARLEGQCEVHAYVEGKNRAWLADLIQDALDAGMLRRGMGWDGPPAHPYGKGDGVIPLLRSRDDEPVVTSYSVCDSFPYAAREVMPLPPEDWRLDGWSEQEWNDLSDESRDDYRDQRRAETFGDLPDEEQWARGMTWLRERSASMMLELRPDDWLAFKFGRRLSLLDLEVLGWRERIEALALPEEKKRMHKVAFLRNGVPDEIAFHCRPDAEAFLAWLEGGSAGIHPEIVEVEAASAPPQEKA